MKLENLTYNVIIYKTEYDNYEVNIPDFELEVGAYGSTIDEALKMAKSVIVSEIEDIINNSKILNSPISFEKIQKYITDKEQRIVSINFDYIYEQSLITQVFKNRTVTLPTWLDMLARNKKLNFSQILQQALKKELGIAK